MFSRLSTQTTRRWLLLVAALWVLGSGASGGHLHLEPGSDHQCVACQQLDTADRASTGHTTPTPLTPVGYIRTLAGSIPAIRAHARYLSRAPPAYS